MDAKLKDARRGQEVSACPSLGISIWPAICRICHSGESSVPYNGLTSCEPLISPCLCKGTMGLYHRSCLERWLTASNTSCCEICKFSFQIGQRYRSFWEFVTEKDNDVERRNLLTDIVCFFFLTPIAFGCIAFCILGAITPRIDGRGGMVVSKNIGGVISLFLLGMLLMLTYVAWLVITLLFHLKSYAVWRSTNVEKFVMDQLTERESFLINGVNKKLASKWPNLKTLNCTQCAGSSTASLSGRVVTLPQPETNNMPAIENNAESPSYEAIDVLAPESLPAESNGPDWEQTVVVGDNEPTGRFMASTPLCVPSPCKVQLFNFSAVCTTVPESNNERDSSV